MASRGLSKCGFGGTVKVRFCVAGKGEFMLKVA